MSARIFPIDEPWRPAPTRNNLWYEDRNCDQVIVFVHGVLSDSHGCWYRRTTESRPGVYWPDLVKRDCRFDNYSIYLGGYYTDVKSSQYEVSDCAEELRNALRRPDAKTGRRVIDHKTVIFVCHSMGGIVIRYLLTTRPWEFKEIRVGLALVASPSYGSPWADRLDFLLLYFKHEQGVQLKWGNWHLRDVDGRFKILLHEKAIPIFGAEACEHRFILDKTWMPPQRPIVPRDSAGVYFGRVRMLPDTDHFTCVKPNDADHPVHQFLLDFCDDLSTGNTDQLKPVPADVPPPSEPTISVSNADDSVCHSVHWDVKIDEEGDAYNEITYQGIVLSGQESEVLELPPAEVQSGHTTEYQLVWDGCTSEGTSLEYTAASTPMQVQMAIRFAQCPSRSSPARAAVRSWDWNVYAMNMEEYRQKPTWREDGLDYAEKYIPEKWGGFGMLIQFPQQLVFAKQPFFEIYDPAIANQEELRNHELTTRYQDSFHYSRALNQAILSVPLPPSPFNYRISWLLGESRASVASPLIPVQRQRQRAFARTLLSMRRTLNGLVTDNIAELRKLEEGVNSTLASLAQYVQKKLGGTELDPAGFEISLMVLDEDRPEQPTFGTRKLQKLPVLRVVAGTGLDDPNYRSLYLFVGDGNAGRAWKRRMARVFDKDEKDPKRHVYVPISATLRHHFLLSFPLIDPDSEALVYGIVNVGAFSDEQAELLRPIGASEQVQELTSYAQSYLLKRLMELVNLYRHGT